MAGGSTSEEMDAFDDVTPAKPVSIYDLDEDLPTRAQSSDEIAEFQQKAREKREAAFRSFAPPTERRTSDPLIITPPPAITDHRGSDPGSGANARPVPRESGPVRIDRLRVPPPNTAAPSGAPAPDLEPDFEKALSDVAATLQRLPPAPRLPRIEQPRGSLETIGSVPRSLPPPVRRPRWPITLALAILVAVAVWVALSFFR